MTEQETAPRELLAKGTETSFLREMIGFAARRLMELEVGGLTGAPPGQPAPDLLHGAGEAERMKLAPEPHGVLAALAEAGVQVVEVRVEDAPPRPTPAMAREALGEGVFADSGSGQAGLAVDAPERPPCHAAATAGPPARARRRCCWRTISSSSGCPRCCASTARWPASAPATVPTTPRYLLRLLELELLDRERRLVEWQIRQVRFPATKGLDSFVFTAIPSLNRMMVLELARCEYILRWENTIALGNSVGPPARYGDVAKPITKSDQDPVTCRRLLRHNRPVRGALALQ